LFQSLTGSIHTRFNLLIGLEKVSIPHRQRNNNVSIPHRFNSHIAKDVKLMNPGQARLFQSLTGSIHTEFYALQISLTIFAFQSLTGSIHTSLNIKEGSLSEDARLSVSIPHRFNSHKTEVKL
jgi:hypothetical protein